MPPFATLPPAAVERSEPAGDQARAEHADAQARDRFRAAFERARAGRPPREHAGATNGQQARSEGADIAADARGRDGGQQAVPGSDSALGPAVHGVPLLGLMVVLEDAGIEVVGGDGAEQLADAVEGPDLEALAALAADHGLVAHDLVDALRALVTAAGDEVGELSAADLADVDPAGAASDTVVKAIAVVRAVMASSGAGEGGDAIAELLEGSEQLGDAESAQLRQVVELTASLAMAAAAIHDDQSLADVGDELELALAALRATGGEGDPEAVERLAAAAASGDGKLEAATGRGQTTDEQGTDEQGTEDEAEPPAMMAQRGRARRREAGYADTSGRGERSSDGEGVRATSPQGRGAAPAVEPPGPPSTAASRMGLARSPSLPAGVQRVLEAVEQLEQLSPPRNLTLDIGEVRIRVAMDDGQLRLSLLDGDMREGEELLEDARQELLERGFDLDGDDEPPQDPDGEEHPPTWRSFGARQVDVRDRPLDTSLRL